MRNNIYFVLAVFNDSLFISSHSLILNSSAFINKSVSVLWGLARLLSVLIIILVLPPGVVCSSNGALPVLGTADGDAVSRCQPGLGKSRQCLSWGRPVGVAWSA